jgi:two-component system sensor histidine kinase KdpD
VPPFLTIDVDDLRHVVTFVVMLVVGLAVSDRTVRMHEQAQDAREREQRTSALFVLSRDLARADDVVLAARAVVEHVGGLLGRDAILYLVRAGQLRKLAGDPAGRFSNERERAVAEWVAEHRRPAGRGTDTLPASAGLHLPLDAPGGLVGVLGVAAAEDAPELLPSQRQLLETSAAQAAVALERILLRQEAAAAQLAAETERTRSTLLSAVSHDLRTPLASISGSAQVLLDEAHPVAPEARRELLETVREESERLGRLVGNLLELTRLETGALKPAREWCPLDEIVESALRSARERLAGREVRRELPEDVVEVHGDAMLLEQALVNLLENAAKHTPPGTPIDVAARAAGEDVVFEVADRGPGVPAGEERLVFERFFRGADARGVQGSGLGLAVVQAIARTHQGEATVAAREGGGSRFLLRIPGARTAGPEPGP